MVNFFVSLSFVSAKNPDQLQPRSVRSQVRGSAGHALRRGSETSCKSRRNVRRVAIDKLQHWLTMQLSTAVCMAYCDYLQQYVWLTMRLSTAVCMAYYATIYSGMYGLLYTIQDTIHLF